MLIIDEIEYYLPKNKISNEDLLKSNKDWDIETIEKSTGVSTRYYTDQEENRIRYQF